jgi:hypothetical protein
VGHHDEGDADAQRRRREELAERRQAAGRGPDPDDGEVSAGARHSTFAAGDYRIGGAG